MAARRLLLVAMSGVRVYNAELLRKGLTLPGFVERSQVIASLPSLGLLTLAAHTPEHWEVEYLEVDERTPEIDERLRAGGYDLVAISALTARILDAYALADELRANGVTVVIGGLHASALPLEAKDHADAVVQGEGESVWAQLLADFERGGLKPLYSTLDGSYPVHGLDQARVPRYDLLDIRHYNRLTLQTTRGCPLDCDFCAASRLISRYKVKPLEQVRRDLEAIIAMWPGAFLELADDNTFAHKTWARDLVGVLGEFGRPWFTETDLSLADDDALLRNLAQAHCAQVLIGLESVRPQSLQGVDSRRWKQSQLALHREKIAKIQSYGIAVNGCFVLGFDEDTPSVFDETLEFVLDSGLADVQITLLTPFPGTALTRRLEQQQRLLKPVYWDQCTLFDVTYVPARMTAAQLEQGFGSLMESVYSTEAVAARKKVSRECVRTRRNGQLEENYVGTN